MSDDARLADPHAPLGDIEVGLTVDQAAAIVQEFDALWSHSNFLGKRAVKHLRTLRDTLAAHRKEQI